MTAASRIIATPWENAPTGAEPFEENVMIAAKQNAAQPGVENTMMADDARHDCRVQLTRANKGSSAARISH